MMRMRSAMALSIPEHKVKRYMKYVLQDIFNSLRDPEELKELLQEESDFIQQGHIDLDEPVTPTPTRRTLLGYCAEWGLVESIPLLANAGADLNASGFGDLHNLNPLHLAALNIKKDCVEVLLKLGANTETRGHGRTALWEVCYRSAYETSSRLELVKLLVDAGANLEAEDYRGQTVLQVASEKNADVTQFLIDAGADASKLDP